MNQRKPGDFWTGIPSFLAVLVPLLTPPPQYACCKEGNKGGEKGQNKILDVTVLQILVTSRFLQLGY